jgi:hypothetical protein
VDIRVKEIKMCEKAEDLQNLWVPTIGDLMFSRFDELNMPTDKDVQDITPYLEVLVEDRSQYYFSITFERYSKRWIGDIPTTRAAKVWIPSDKQLTELLAKNDVQFSLNSKRRSYILTDGLGTFKDQYTPFEVSINTYLDNKREQHKTYVGSTCKEVYLKLLMWVLFDKEWLENSEIWVNNS